VRDGAQAAMKTIQNENRNLDIHTIKPEDLVQFNSLLDREQFDLIEANIVNRDLAQTAKALLDEETVDHGRLGGLLNAHQAELRDRLRISTPKIDRMIDASLKHGALGAKINGSGGGGCMFAYAPDSYEQVAEAITGEGGTPYIIAIDEGARVEYQH
ncbi:GHMP kinase, partial [candidate division KSB1 bacterium]